ncbi:DUF4132 domain-containing protein [Glycomyces sp. NPDC047010]|uniref:DUF4132 domain-containing protein n=1 Tax=Glycomyces sp. NPDC047010 TaxID=3155023 RepID=UPI0033ECED63
MTPEAPALPAAWTAKLLPRRGTRPGTPTEPDPDAPDLLAERFEVHADLLARILHMKRNRRHRQTIGDYLSGAPDVAGAVAAGELLRHVGPHTPDEWTRLELDAWLVARGLPWTLSAFIERHAVELAAHLRDGVRPQTGHLYLTDSSWYEYRSLHRDMDNGVIAGLRARLAAASDDEYRAVVAAVAEHRRGPSQRLTAALLLPDEADWVAEVCDEYHEHRSSGTTDRFLYHFVSTTAHLKAARVHRFEEYYLGAEHIAAALDSLGPKAFGLLSRTFGSRWHVSAANCRLLVKGLALLPEGAVHLVEKLDKAYVFDGAVEAARRHPGPVLRAVAAAAPDAAPAQRGRLAAVAAAAGTLDGLTDAERAAIAGLAQRTVPDADPADLPYLFTAPPWTVKRRKPKPQVIDGLEPVGEPRLAWNDGERERWLDLVASYVDDPEAAARWRGVSARRLTGDSARYLLPSLLAFGPPDVADPYYEQWLATDAEPGQDQVLAILARYGPDSIPKAVKAAEYCDFDQVLGPVFSLGAARHVAERYARRKTDRALAAGWFERHGPAVATVLVPDALGADKDRRKYAEAALFHLAVRLGDKEVVAAAEPYGPEAVAAVAALFDGDPLEPRGAKPPKPGPWAVPVMFPQVLLADGGRALPDDAVRHLLAVLALATPEYPYPGLDVVAATCDRASLARFSRAVFEQWLAVGAPAKDQWALTQLAHFAEDATVWLLADRLRTWPGDGQHKRAVTGLGVLGAIGTEEALRAIQTTADKVQFKGLMYEAMEQIRRIAEELGLSRDQLADRLVPDFGLGDADVLTVDYGTRKFTVAFDEQLRPFVIDEAGKARKSLPKPGAKDDDTVADDAYQRFQALRKELKSVAKEQVTRLEAAMVSGRTWDAGEFRRYLADHALTGQLARRLVWLADGAAFRIAEDGTFSDLADDAFELPASASVRLAHPALLGDATGRWAELLADYEVLQPFDQLARPVLAFTAEELSTGRLPRFEGAAVDTGRLLGLSRRGWARGYPGDGGLVPGFTYMLASRCFLVLHVAPGIDLGYTAEHPVQTTASVHFVDLGTFGTDPVPPTGPIDPVAAAEALGALARLTGS